MLVDYLHVIVTTEIYITKKLGLQNKIVHPFKIKINFNKNKLLKNITRGFFK